MTRSNEKVAAGRSSGCHEWRHQTERASSLLGAGHEVLMSESLLSEEGDEGSCG